jgi:predicted nucleotidyltransferase
MRGESAVRSNAERLEIAEAALPHVDTQLELVRRRKQAPGRLETELVDKRKRILARRRELAR